MIDLNAIPETPSDRIAKRAAAMWIRRIRSVDGKLTFRVTPHGSEFEHKSKSKRIVVLDLVNETAECFDRFTGEECAANSDSVPGSDQPKRPHLCSHVFAVVKSLGRGQRRAA